MIQITREAPITLSIPEIQQHTTPSFTTWLGEGLRQLTLFPLMHLLFHIRVSGYNNLSTTGPYIFAANHASHLDAPLLLTALPLHLRLRIGIAAAADYFFSNPLKGTFVSLLLNAFPFERKGRNSANSLTHCLQRLATGKSLLIFPEGTRSRDGQIHTFKHGVGMLALASTASVIPVRIDGTFTALPKGARRLQQRHLHIMFGPAIDLSSIHDVHQATITIEQAIRTCSDETPSLL